MLRLTNRLFNDKDIGKVVLNGVRRYTVGNPEWEKYNSQIANTYSSNFKHDEALTDTIVSQTNKIRDLGISSYHQSREIRELQTAIKQLNEDNLQNKEKLYNVTWNFEYLTHGIINERFDELLIKVAELSQKVDELSKK
jgi:hypothetical protein